MTKKYMWCTDTHLDFLDPQSRVTQRNAITRFCGELRREIPVYNGLLLTGDISVSDRLDEQLLLIQQNLNCPIYYVCGNHDFYGSSIAERRVKMAEISRLSGGNLNYLTTTGPVRLDDNVWIVGDDGWYDAGWGDYHSSRFYMNDWQHIEEFRAVGGMSRQYMNIESIVSVANTLARRSAERILTKVNEAAGAAAKEIIILTHVPPFPQSAYYNGSPTSPEYLPWYTSRQTGEVLLELADAHPTVQFKVLCGHTHSNSSYSPRQNMSVFVGRSTYGSPGVSGIIETHTRLWVHYYLECRRTNETYCRKLDGICAVIPERGR